MTSYEIVFLFKRQSLQWLLKAGDWHGQDEGLHILVVW